MRNGATDITAYREGFVYPENPEFYYRFGVRRNPRTLAGVMTQGNNLLLVAVDGRRPDYSVGTNFVESARIMKALEAEGAVNLACELVEKLLCALLQARVLRRRSSRQQLVHSLRAGVGGLGSEQVLSALNQTSLTGMSTAAAFRRSV